MQEIEYRHMYDEEGYHWWYRGMRSIISALLSSSALPTNPRVLDVGCGTGFNLGWMAQQYAADVTGLDVSYHALSFCRRRGDYDLVLGNASALPVMAELYDLVISFDVLTNLKEASDRETAFIEIFRALKPGGRFLVRVAAYDFLRSSHDIAVMTYHRFGRNELSHLAVAAGFRVLRVTGANTILFPGALIWRLLKKMGVAPQGSDVRETTRGGAFQNRLLESCLRLESAVLRRCNLPFGLSMLLLAEKPAGNEASSPRRGAGK